ncbi:hypothetical protein N8Z59_03650 [Planktomarina temperata]|nr:hypothetical protein [Planktomarina temperata]
MIKKRLNLIELNEINFDLVKKYIEEAPGNYPGFEKLFTLKEQITHSEAEYQNLEPWIQWVSVHTKKTHSEHKIFRLGDIEKFYQEQIFETVERMGYKVGCISPMNASNKLLNPAFFIPDPWTETSADSQFLSKQIHGVLRQAVNDNARERLSFKTIIIFLIFFILYSNMNNFRMYFDLFRNRKKKWNKALFLDLFLTDLFCNWHAKHNVDFGTLFLNSFAHIQHHYLLNSKHCDTSIQNPEHYIDKSEDPIADAIVVYDRILAQLFQVDTNYRMFATGLQQVPVKETIYHYRLKDHAAFLTDLGLVNFSVSPRMTRDFEIIFHTTKDQLEGEKILKALNIDDKRFFGVIEHRDDRSTFCSLTYDQPLPKDQTLQTANQQILLTEHLVFVAVKNAEHDGKGYLYTDLQNRTTRQDVKSIHVREIGAQVESYFA